MNPTTPHALDTQRWTSTFPWLELTPEEHEAVDRLSGPELDQFAVSVARRAIENQVTTPLYLLGLPQGWLTSDLYRPEVGAGRMLLCPRLTHPSSVVM